MWNYDFLSRSVVRTYTQYRWCIKNLQFDWITLFRNNGLVRKFSCGLGEFHFLFILKNAVIRNALNRKMKWFKNKFQSLKSILDFIKMRSIEFAFETFLHTRCVCVISHFCLRIVFNSVVLRCIKETSRSRYQPFWALLWFEVLEIPHLLLHI